MIKKGAVTASTAVVKRAHSPGNSGLQVIREIEAGKTQAQVAREYQITNSTISKSRRDLRQYKERAFAGRGHAHTDELESTNWNAWWAGSPWRMSF